MSLPWLDDLVNQQIIQILILLPPLNLFRSQTLYRICYCRFIALQRNKYKGDYKNKNKHNEIRKTVLLNPVCKILE